MKVTIELDSVIIDAIATRKAIDRAYDWGNDPDIKDDLNEMYATAFAEGMQCVLEMIEK